MLILVPKSDNFFIKFNKKIIKEKTFGNKWYIILKGKKIFFYNQFIGRCVIFKEDTDMTRYYDVGD